ncbi:hypothetical protein CMQ_4268 [Grosmannia clavigera kw1407]|uniref:Uncharacterized protein n=1 Tax=Grosmannia clavigera (strain kw1407 / UAMH 11150) TaxID=655863 RepID=F0XTY3_GROCL|nr:uncharacterized protein CMQ_4268 [Grosmannia clavigera kw1407]EFW98416.1 hypothetical protein CMQ_4268 [Grosmannia clavigera kw1407]
MDSAERRDYLLQRGHLPSNAVIEFMENRVMVGSGTALVFSESSSEFVSVDEIRREQEISAELWAQANAQKAQLFDLLEQVNKKLDKKSGKISPVPGKDLRKCDWDEVLQEIQTTTQRWSNGPRRGSKVAQVISRLGNSSEAFNSWIQLLPAGDYGSSICGAFTLIIGAAEQYSHVEEAVLEGLAKIPEIIDGAKRYVQIYAQQKKNRLERRTFDIYLAILRALVHMLKFILEGSLHYRMLLDVQNDELSGLQGRKMLGAPRTSTKGQVKKLQRLLRFDPNAVASDVEACLRSGNALDERGQSKAAALIRAAMFQRFMRDETSSGSLLVNGNEDQASVDGPSPLTLVAAKLVTIAQAVGDGADSDAAADAEAKAVARSGSTYVVSYFCDRHVPYGGGDAFARSPEGLMASLSGQLLEQMRRRRQKRRGTAASVDVDLSFVKADTWTKMQAGRYDLRRLSQLFIKLTGQLAPSDVLLCVLDEVSLYDTGTLRSGLLDVLRRLTCLAGSAEGGPCVKLLATCRGTAGSAGQYFASRSGKVLELDGEGAEIEDSAAWEIAHMR